LPIIQGSSFVYLPVIASLLSGPQWRCPATLHAADNETLAMNETEMNQMQFARDLWRPRILEASGALIMASIIQVCVGCFGLVGFMTRFIGPLTISSMVILLGLSFGDVIVKLCQQHWGIALLTAAICLIFSTILADVNVPYLSWNRARGCRIGKLNLFRLFPQAIAIAMGWSLAAILTATNSLPDDPHAIGYKARTDISTEWIVQSDWIFIPYPGLWGWPTFAFSSMFGMLTASICSIIESVGDYYATAKACSVPLPPKHALNRGIAIEGFGSVLCGLMGAGHATTSYSQTIGFISLNGMASRTTWLVAGVFLMVAGVCGKLSAIMSSIPEPVIGGLMLISIGMVVSVGLSALNDVDLNSGRNQVILGVSLISGTAFPIWVATQPNAIKTGSGDLDQIISIFLSTSMFLGGTVACFLDNILPAKGNERGFAEFQHKEEKEDTRGMSADIYNFPLMKTPTVHADPGYEDSPSKSKTNRILSYFPFLPFYIDRSFKCCSNPCRSKTTHAENGGMSV